MSCQSEYFCSQKYLWLHSILCNHVKCICARKPRKKRKKKQKTESYNKLYHGIALGGKKTYLLLDA